MAKRNLTYLIIGLVLLVVGYNVALHISRRGLDKIIIKPIPSDSQVTVDGKKVSSGSVYVSPGKHTLVAHREYFVDDLKNINTATDKDQVIYLLPDPATDKALEWLSQHPSEQAEREGIISDITAKTQADILAKNPIVEKLPEYNSKFRIDYTITVDNDISYQVTLYPIVNGPGDYDRYVSQLRQYRDAAYAFLKTNGIDPNKANITITPTVP